MTGERVERVVWISLVTRFFPTREGSAQWGPGEREHLQTRDLADSSSNSNSAGRPRQGQSEILNVVLDNRIRAVVAHGVGDKPVRGSTNTPRSSPLSITSRSHPKSPSEEGKAPVPLTLVVYPNGGRFGDTFGYPPPIDGQMTEGHGPTVGT